MQWMNICSTKNSRIVQWMTIFSAVIRRFAVDDNVLLESKKEQVKQAPEPSQHELVLKASEEAGFSKTVDVGQ